MLAVGDLTTYAGASAYLASPPPQAVLTGLITRMSRTILGHLNRATILPWMYTEQFNGSGTTALVLPHWPIIGASLTQLLIDGVSISLAPQPIPGAQTISVPYGYRFQPSSGVPPGSAANVVLVGGAYFRRGNQNVYVQYNAGYQVTGEAPTETPWTPLAPWGNWATDQGVAYATSGHILTPIPSGVPTVGQYIPPHPDLIANPTTQYVFNAADVATGLILSYGFVPADLEQAVIEWIAERSSYRTRVGVRSQMLASQESVAYDTAGIPAYLVEMLAPYVSVLPPAIGANV